MLTQSSARRRRGLRRGAAMMLAAVALTSCSSSTPKPTTAASTTPSAASPDVPPGSTPASTAAQATSPAPSGSGAIAACSLVTAADVATAYGEQFDAGKASAPGGQSSCLFVQSGGGVDQVGLLISQGADAAIYYTTNKGGYPGTDVAGLGDKGFVSTDGGMVGTQRGSVAVLVHLVGFTSVAPAALQAKQETFTRLVLSRIK